MNNCKRCGEPANGIYCSRRCCGLAHGRKRGDDLHNAAIAHYNANPNRCKQCQSPILLDARAFNVRQKIFCDQSCAATYNNAHPTEAMINGRRGLRNRCIDCSAYIYSCNRRCMACYQALPTIRDAKKKSELTHAEIREHARRATRKWSQACAWCRYDKFVETCHLKPVSSFSPETILAEINADSNLILACPNCHWEFDHGMLVAPPRIELGHVTAYEAAALPIELESHAI